MASFETGTCVSAAEERPESDQQRAAARDVSAQAVFEAGRHRADVGKDHEGVFRKRLIGGLLHGQRLEREAGFGYRFERGAIVQLVALLPGGMQKQNRVRIGALDGEIETIVFVQRIAGLDADLAFVETVRRFERQEFDGGAAVGGNIHRFAFEHLAVQHQRNGALGGWRVRCPQSRPARGLSSDRRSWRAR